MSLFVGACEFQECVDQKWSRKPLPRMLNFERCRQRVRDTVGILLCRSTEKISRMEVRLTSRNRI